MLIVYVGPKTQVSVSLTLTKHVKTCVLDTLGTRDYQFCYQTVFGLGSIEFEYPNIPMETLHGISDNFISEVVQ